MTVPEDAPGKLLHLPVRGEPVPGTDLEPAPEAVEGELVDEPAPAPVPTGATVWRPPGQLHPVVAPWLRDRLELRSRIEWAARYVWHTSRFHAVRLPLYGARVLAASPRGAFRSVAGAGRWVSGPELAAAARAAAADPKAMVVLLERQ
jgi:S-DNA-T family DNA segregation ATPase FtsK/SpoIIIE